MAVAYNEAGDTETAKKLLNEAIGISKDVKSDELWSFHFNLANILVQAGKMFIFWCSFSQWQSYRIATNNCINDLYNTGWITHLWSKHLKYQDGRFMYPNHTLLIQILIRLYSWMTKSCQSEHLILENQYGGDDFKILLAEYLVCMIQYYIDQ